MYIKTRFYIHFVDGYNNFVQSV